jgi:hypothetical protein
MKSDVPFAIAEVLKSDSRFTTLAAVGLIFERIFTCRFDKPQSTSEFGSDIALIRMAFDLLVLRKIS